MSKKYYVVWKGVTPGIYDTWPQAQAQIQGRPDAQFMGFASFEQAQQAYGSSYAKALEQRTKEKGGKPTQGKTGSGPKKTTATKPKAAAKANNSADINIYCDGACSPNPGKSGTGIAVYAQQTPVELWYGLYEPNGTNNTAELNGMLEAFKMAAFYLQQGKSVQVLSDSKYSIDCITKWAKGWKNKGWTRASGEPIKNLPVIQACFQLYEQMSKQLMSKQLEITHVRGHADIEGNELSDRMAVLARSNQETGFVRYQQAIDIPAILAMPSG